MSIFVHSRPISCQNRPKSTGTPRWGTNFGDLRVSGGATRPLEQDPWERKFTESANLVKNRARKWTKNIGNPYQMEDNKNPKGAARSAAPLGRRRRRRLVVFHLVRISYVFASFLEPVLTPGIIFSPGRINFLIRAGENFIINVWG